MGVNPLSFSNRLLGRGHDENPGEDHVLDTLGQGPREILHRTLLKCNIPCIKLSAYKIIYTGDFWIYIGCLRKPSRVGRIVGHVGSSKPWKILSKAVFLDGLSGHLT